MPSIINKNQMDALAVIANTVDVTKRLERLVEFVKLKPTDSTVLQEFNRIFQQIHYNVISHISKETLTSYLKFLQTLFGAEHRFLLSKREIRIDARNLQEIAVTIARKVKVIDESLQENFSSALKLSFDIPRFLKEYNCSATIELARRCFLEKDTNIHGVTTRFFHLLGYQGQLLFYYAADSKFSISAKFLNETNEKLLKSAITLQQYFFDSSKNRNDITRSLLEHYFYIIFIKTIYKDEPSRLASILHDTHFNSYFNANYNPLPKQVVCANLPADYQVTIEYANLPEGVPEMACQSIACSERQFGNWKTSLATGLQPLKLKSNYIYRVSGSYKDYHRDPYAFGQSPKGGGFYIQGSVENNTVYGIGYSFWEKDVPNFIEVSRHEAVHHDVYRMQMEFSTQTPQRFALTKRNINEALAVQFSGGACAEGYINQATSKPTSLDLAVLLGSDFIGYHEAWLANNYLINTYGSFYQDFVMLNKDIFFSKWKPIIDRDRGFYDWPKQLKEICQRYALKKLVDGCPSIYLQDYSEPSFTEAPLSVKTVPSAQTVTFTSGSSIGLTEEVFNHYIALLRAISENNLMGIARIAKETPGLAIFNYNDPRWGTPLFYVFDRYREKCPPRLIESLLAHGASPTLCNKFGKTPYQVAQQRCKNSSEIKSIFDSFMQKPADITTEIPPINTTMDSNTTELDIYKRKKPASLQVIIPLPVSYFFSGALSASLDRFANSKREKYPFFPSCMTYGLKPILFSLGNSIYDSLVLGSASTIQVEGQWSSFSAYLAMNYMGLVIAQPVSRKISALVDQKLINKYWNIAVKFALQALTFMFLFNPGLFFSEEFIQRISFMVILQVFNGMFFSAGELATHALFDYFSHSKNASEASKASSVAKERHNANSTEVIRLIPVNSVMNSEGNAENAEALSLIPFHVDPIFEEDSDLPPPPEEWLSSPDSSTAGNRDSGRGSSLAYSRVGNNPDQTMFLFRLETIKKSLETLQNKLQAFSDKIHNLKAFSRMFEDPLNEILQKVNNAMSSDDYLAFRVTLERFITGQGEDKKSLKSIEAYLNALERRKGNKKEDKKTIQDFHDALSIEINYINFYAQKWLDMLRTGIFVTVENEVAQQNAHVLLTKKMMVLARSYFCQLERLTSYVAMEERLSIDKALQGLKAIFFHTELESLIDKPFSSVPSQLIKQCALCATNFDLATKQLIIFESPILNIEESQFRKDFYRVWQEFKKLCEQTNYSFTNRIDRTKADTQGINKGIELAQRVMSANLTLDSNQQVSSSTANRPFSENRSGFFAPASNVDPVKKTESSIFSPALGT